MKKYVYNNVNIMISKYMVNVINSRKKQDSFISKEEQNVLDSKNPKRSYWYCKNNKDAHVELHEEVVIKYGNEEDAYFFAKDIKKVNIENLEKAVINSGNAEYIYAFYTIKGANKNNLEQAMIKSGDKYWFDQFIKYAIGTNIEEYFNKNILPTGDICLINDFVNNYSNL